MKPEERHQFERPAHDGSDTANEGSGPESQRFFGFYHVQTEEPPHPDVITLESTLNRNDFDAVFTGNFSLCQNDKVRILAEQGHFFSAKVLSDSLGFLHPVSPGQLMRVYFFPVAKVEYEQEPTNQTTARAVRTKLMKQNQPEIQIPVRQEAVYEEEAVQQPEFQPRGRTRRLRREAEDDDESFQDDDKVTRRLFMVSAAIGAGALIFRFRHELGTALSNLFMHSSGSESNGDLKGPLPETNEKPRIPKPLETVLEASKRIFLSDSKTWRDNILKRDAVSQYFLGGKFRYMDVETGEYNGTQQNFYHFAVIGEKSGQLDARKGSEKQYLSTGIADTANILLETGAIGQDAVKSWIVWMYKRSFGIVLRPERLHLKWKDKLSLGSVLYVPEPGFPQMAGIEVVEKMDPGEEQPGGNVSKKREPQDILGQGNSLLLPSGISPQHDIVVPQALMKGNPAYTLKFANTWEWKGVTAETLSERIRSFEERVKSKGNRRMEGFAFGRPVPIEYIAPLVDRNDPLIQQLSASLLKGIPEKNHQARITALYRFVQSLPYRTEYDTDVDRPSFITLFNGGGDCNNLTILFNELMLAAGYDTAILWVAFNKNHYVTHTRGGIPAKYFPGARHWTNGAKKWVPIELAGKQVFSPGMDAWDSDETTFFIEEMER